jgi:hypothetical protein
MEYLIIDNNDGVVYNKVPKLNPEKYICLHILKFHSKSWDELIKQILEITNNASFENNKKFTWEELRLNSDLFNEIGIVIDVMKKRKFELYNPETNV